MTTGALVIFRTQVSNR